MNASGNINKSCQNSSVTAQCFSPSRALWCILDWQAGDSQFTNSMRATGAITHQGKYLCNCSAPSMYLPVLLWGFVWILFATRARLCKGSRRAPGAAGTRGDTGAHSRPSLEQMFADPFLQCLPSPDLSFISSADSFPCSSTSLASWKLGIFWCGAFQGTLGKVSHWLIRNRECKKPPGAVCADDRGVASAASAKSSWLLLKCSWNLQG